jgi:hypothetical protein
MKRDASHGVRRARSEALRKTTVFLGDSHHAWLHELKSDALREGEDLTASSVVRLALNRLRDLYPTWTPMKDQMPFMKPEDQRPGRRRR